MPMTFSVSLSIYTNNIVIIDDRQSSNSIFILPQLWNVLDDERNTVPWDAYNLVEADNKMRKMKYIPIKHMQMSFPFLPLEDSEGPISPSLSTGLEENSILLQQPHSTSMGNSISHVRDNQLVRG